MAHLKRRAVIHGIELAFDGIDDAGPAVPCIDAPQPGRAVEHLAPVVGDVVHVFGGHEKARRCFELAVCGESLPKCLQVVIAWFHDFSVGMWRFGADAILPRLR